MREHHAVIAIEGAKAIRGSIFFLCFRCYERCTSSESVKDECVIHPWLTGLEALRLVEVWTRSCRSSGAVYKPEFLHSVPSLLFLHQRRQRAHKSESSTDGSRWLIYCSNHKVLISRPDISCWASPQKLRERTRLPCCRTTSFTPYISCVS